MRNMVLLYLFILTEAAITKYNRLVGLYNAYCPRYRGWKVHDHGTSWLDSWCCLWHTVICLFLGSSCGEEKEIIFPLIKIVLMLSWEFLSSYHTLNLISIQSLAYVY